jgi:DNA-directed RNA polymerase specialized sigma24 family protein
MPNGPDSEYLAYVHGRVTALRRTAYLLSGDTHQADDIVQETLTKLYARWPRMQAVDNLDAYVNTMLVRTFVDDRRRGWWTVALMRCGATTAGVRSGSGISR